MAVAEGVALYSPYCSRVDLIPLPSALSFPRRFFACRFLGWQLGS
ncbi:hypothetical protein COLO4_27914 [Corchorus olitorius]|uniref:Uncharacterized protein n=1 Tax=Corchorus olitorius TaxID=93759 RepID=A0A1R3HNS0_9ROSI|nr:hypothetical protein COLO4_27914 [Corchorus olitorius]